MPANSKTRSFQKMESVIGVEVTLIQTQTIRIAPMKLAMRNQSFCQMENVSLAQMERNPTKLGKSASQTAHLTHSIVLKATYARVIHAVENSNSRSQGIVWMLVGQAYF